MQKLRFLPAFIVICSLTLTSVHASAPASPKIVFGNDSSEVTAQTEDENDTQRLLIEYAEGTGKAENENDDWFSAIEGFFSIKKLEETAAAYVPAAEKESEIRTIFIEDTTYVSIRDFIERNYPNAVFNYENGKVSISHQGFYIEFTEGAIYYYVNGRILPLNRTCFEQDGCFYVPLRSLALIYSYDVAWNEEAFTATLNENGKILLSGQDYYNYDDYILLAKLIRAESGNQPLDGKIAVGNVIINRVKNSAFPDTIADVIFDRRCGIQFTTAYNGSLSKAPTEECLVAAKLCLEGYSVTNSSLYFFNPSTCSAKWIKNHRQYVTTIGDHAFYS
ncbi:MAG: cell wall hydrolase [Clostridiaceae bacterium]|nr:cell wall hydrolase [Clostridiaceae bacterium]